MRTDQELEAKLAEPSQRLIEDLTGVDGDIMILGVGGKMGPSLARLAQQAVLIGRLKKRIIGVSRFSTGRQQELEEVGIETISADLLDDQQLNSLPDVRNVIYMAGKKFGTVGQEYMTWAMNTYLPGRVAEKYKNSRIVVFSSGNVYPLTPVGRGGTDEAHSTGPIGEYAQSCLGRERVFEYHSYKYQIPMIQFRLNYAIDLRYGILLEVAQAVKEQRPIDLSMGHVNVIWQGDANEMALRSLAYCQQPPRILNITGPETVSIRWLAERFGEKFNLTPQLVNSEQDTALLSNASTSHQLFGYPKTSLRQMIDWVAEWISIGGETLGKPTHYQERQGAY